MTTPIFDVLFLSARNSSRSILAESILRKEGQGRFRAFSAGIEPTPNVNPLALQVLSEADYPTDALYAKSIDMFVGSSASSMNFIFTLCDMSRGEKPPEWPGQPITADWNLEDPAANSGTELEKKAAFITAVRYLKNRIGAFVALPISSLDQAALKAEVQEIGQHRA